VINEEKKMGTVNPGNNPFVGGSITRTGQANVAGSIPSANTSVANPIAGVSPGITFSARNNQGSNIGIPYTRLVPLYFDLKNPDIKNRITPTEDLRATTVGFILGKRSQIGSGKADAPSYDYHMAVNSNMAPGMPGTERFQKMCSLEYLQDYFKVMFEKTAIVIDSTSGPISTGGTMTKTKINGDAAKGLFASGLPRMLKSMVNTDSELKTDVKNALDASTIQNVAGLRQALGMTGSKAKDEYDLVQGLFFRDEGPFLRGKAGVHELLLGTLSNMPQRDTSTNKDVQPYQVNRSVGDDLAFALFDQILESNGLSDWRPDGIVLSKGADDPSDAMSDAYLKARDGELYNMRVQGPAITSSWVGVPEMEVMPLDKVFVVIVADVWFDKSPGELKYIEGSTSGTLEDYNTAKDQDNGTGMNGMTEAVFTSQFRDKQISAYTTNEKVVVTNFRVRLATSSEMINTSGLKFSGNSAHTGGTDMRGSSRMGLKLGLGGGEYIVGGWCIGNVLDTSASRAAFANKGNIGVRTAPNSMAINLNVSIEWWNADRMYRSFMNNGTITPRYVPSKTLLSDLATFPDIVEMLARRGVANVSYLDLKRYESHLDQLKTAARNDSLISGGTPGIDVVLKALSNFKTTDTDVTNARIAIKAAIKAKDEAAKAVADAEAAVVTAESTLATTRITDAESAVQDAQVAAGTAKTAIDKGYLDQKAAVTVVSTVGTAVNRWKSRIAAAKLAAAAAAAAAATAAAAAAAAASGGGGGGGGGGSAVITSGGGP
jgi:hypothetical protein